MSKVTALPTGTNLSIRQIAEETGFDRDTVSKKLTENGVRPAGKRGGHPIYRLRDALKVLYITGADGRADPDKMDPFRRKAHYQAEHEMLDLAKERGELVPRIEVEQEQAIIFKKVAQTLETLPDMLERDCGLIASDVARVEDVVCKLRDALYADLIDETDPGNTAENAASAVL